MVLIDSVPEIAVGIAVELGALLILCGVAYRTLSGRFLVPKRQIVLPNQLGVVVQGDQVLRVAQPGSCWVRPRQRVVLIDARPRPLQMAGLEIIGSDFAIVRVSLGGEYRVMDAATYYTKSTNAGDSLHVQLRRTLLSAARQQTGDSIVDSPELFATRVRENVAVHAERLGLGFVQLEVWEALPMGFLRQPVPPEMDEPSSGLVH